MFCAAFVHFSEEKKASTAHKSKYFLSFQPPRLFLALKRFMSSPVYRAALVLPRQIDSVFVERCRWELVLNNSPPFRILSEQICAVFLSARFWIDWLFVKYLQLYFLRLLNSKKCWKKLKIVKTYCTVHVSSGSGTAPAEDYFFYSDFFFPFLFSFCLAWEEHRNCEC